MSSSKPVCWSKFAICTADNSEVQEDQKETAQVKKQDQSDSDEALYLPPLPPDQLDTVVKVTTAHTDS